MVLFILQIVRCCIADHNGHVCLFIYHRIQNRLGRITINRFMRKSPLWSQAFIFLKYTVYRNDRHLQCIDIRSPFCYNLKFSCKKVACKMNFRIIDHFLTSSNSGYKIIVSTLCCLYRICINRKTFKLKRYPADFTEFFQKCYINSVQLSCFFICIH